MTKDFSFLDDSIEHEISTEVRRSCQNWMSWAGFGGDWNHKVINSRRLVFSKDWFSGHFQDADDDDDDDIEGFSVGNSYMDEKADACEAVGDIAKHTKDAFLPFLQLAFEEVSIHYFIF